MGYAPWEDIIGTGNLETFYEGEKSFGVSGRLQNAISGLSIDVSVEQGCGGRKQLTFWTKFLGVDSLIKNTRKLRIVA